jgi:uncharacterized membrane protein
VNAVYLALKTIHLLAVVAFLGNISVGLYWKAAADATRDAAIMAHTMKSIIRGDRLITIPSIIVLFVAGIAAALNAHVPLLHTGWILWSLALFTISGMAFGPLSRVQSRLAEAAAQIAADAAARERYESLSRAWNVWGLIALGAPVVVLVLMVVKPSLPALP